MSGIEIIGLVLGVLGMLVPVLQDRPSSSWHNFKHQPQRREKYRNRLQMQLLHLQLSFKELTAPYWDDEQQQVMLCDPTSRIWRSHGLRRAIKSRLGNEASYRCFKACILDLYVDVERLAHMLDFNIENISRKSSPRAKQLIDSARHDKEGSFAARTKLAWRSRSIQELLKDITEQQNDISGLISRCITTDITLSIPRRRYAFRWSHTGQAAKTLDDALHERWPCPCIQPHCVHMELSLPTALASATSMLATPAREESFPLLLSTQESWQTALAYIKPTNRDERQQRTSATSSRVHSSVQSRSSVNFWCPQAPHPGADSMSRDANCRGPAIELEVSHREGGVPYQLFQLSRSGSLRSVVHHSSRPLHGAIQQLGWAKFSLASALTASVHHLSSTRWLGRFLTQHDIGVSQTGEATAFYVRAGSDSIISHQTASDPRVPRHRIEDAGQSDQPSSISKKTSMQLSMLGLAIALAELTCSRQFDMALEVNTVVNIRRTGAYLLFGKLRRWLDRMETEKHLYSARSFRAISHCMGCFAKPTFHLSEAEMEEFEQEVIGPLCDEDMHWQVLDARGR